MYAAKEQLGCQDPSTLHLPQNRAQSSGLEAIEFARAAGLFLDPWQEYCLIEGLREQKDHRWSAFEVAVIVSRQNGKGSILEARQLAGLFLLGERLAVHTAHEFKTCFEHFLRITHLIESNPELDKQVHQIRRGAGEQAIELKSGSRLRFLARSGGSGRGLTGDTVYLDEAFALSAPMMGALMPTMSARPNPQMWYMSSAPKSSSDVLQSVRFRGHEGKSPRLFFAEWGNEEGVDPTDREAWRRANPALGIRISEEFIEAELDAMRSMPEEFARERLGVPDRDPAEARQPKIPAAAWEQTWCYCPPSCPETHVHKGRPPAPVRGQLTIAFDVDPDGFSATIAVASGSQTDPYVEVIEQQPGTGWLPARIVELIQRWEPSAVGCFGAGPAGWVVGPVLASFVDAGIDTNILRQITQGEYRQACGGLYRDIVEINLRRPAGQSVLTMAVLDATERVVGDGFMWDARSATIPLSPLVAATVARVLLPTASSKKRPVFAS